MRILHAPLNVANDAWSLVKGFNALGIEADLATIWSNKYTEVGNIDLSFTGLNNLARQIKKWQFCHDELPQYDVLHYHAGRSILDYGHGSFSLMDLRAARKRGQVIAMTYHGCEVRGLHPEHCQNFCTNRVCESPQVQERVKKLKNLVDLFYVTTPDLLSAVPYAELLPQSVWGLEQVAVERLKGELPLKIVHAPSKRETKGTEQIIKNMFELIEDGLALDFRLVENVPHKEAVKAISEADIVIDQLIMGWYGVVSIEAAVRGKMVVVGVDESYVKRSGMDAPPFGSPMTKNLKDVLRELYANRSKLAEYGEQNRAFAIQRHDAVKNAERVYADYQRILQKKSGKV